MPINLDQPNVAYIDSLPGSVAVDYEAKIEAPKPRRARKLTAVVVAAAGVATLGLATTRSGPAPLDRVTLEGAEPIVPIEVAPSSLEPMTEIGPTEIEIPPGSVDCSKESYSLPQTLIASEAKQAVLGMDFFIDDPDELDQLREVIHTTTSHEQAEQFVADVFGARGIEVTYNDQTVENQPSKQTTRDVPLDDYQAQLANLVDAYGKLPVALARVAPKISIVKDLYAYKDKNEDGTIQQDEFKQIGGMAVTYGKDSDPIVAYDITELANRQYAPIIVEHELAHAVDYRTCYDPDDESIYVDLREASPYTAEDSIEVYDGFSEAELAEVTWATITSPYGRKRIAEDKATIMETTATGRYPDQSDTRFDSEFIVQRKQEIMVGRTADYLGIPNIAQLYILRDLYGTDLHPKRIAEKNFSPYQSGLLNYYTEITNWPPTPLQEKLDQTISLAATLPNGVTENLIVGKTEDGGFNLPLTISIPGSSDTGLDTCASNPQVIELIQFAEDVLTRYDGDGKAVSAYFDSVQQDPHDPGKIRCGIQSYTSPL